MDLIEKSFLGHEINSKKSVKKFKELLCDVNDFIGLIELNEDGRLGRFIEVNDIVYKILDYSKHELLKMTPYDLKEIDERIIEDLLEKLLTEGYISSEVIYICKDSKKYPIEINSRIFDLKIKKVVIVIVRNITERKIVEKVFQETEERYCKLVELLPDAVHVKYKGKIVFSNEAGVKLLGFNKRDELIGRYDAEFIHPDYQKISFGRGNTIRSEKNSVPPIEQKCITKDGTVIDVEVTSTPIKFNGDIAILSVLHDITERKRWESMLKETLEDYNKLLAKAIELDKQKTEFFSNISHEFKTPLNVILGSIQLVESFERNNEFHSGHIKINKYISTMKQNCYRLLRLINNLIDINKADSKFIEANLCNYDIVRIVEDITLSVVDFCRNKGLTLIFDTEVEEKVISCDADKIERIMLNLLSNSMKSTEPGDNIYVNIFDKGENIIISVKDTGIGIPDDKLATIFQRFEQIDSSLKRKHEGSGIGLSLVKSFVEMHNGKIWVESQLGVGTEFFIEIPSRKISQENLNCNYNDYGSDLVERINIEFSDIYS